MSKLTTTVAWLALFFSLAGTGLAASHYLITSTSQIKPSVLRALRGRRGPEGPVGLQGATGQTGPTGPAGTVGPASLHEGSEAVVGAFGTGESTAHCEPGERVISSGFILGGVHTQLVGSIPATGGWTIAALDDSSEPGTVSAIVLCVAG